MRAIAVCLSLVALAPPLLFGCQTQQAPSPANPVTENQQAKQPAAPIDPTRAIWQKEKAEISAEVENCELTPQEAIRRLRSRRTQLAPQVKDGKPLHIGGNKIKRIASQAGCPAD